MTHSHRHNRRYYLSDIPLEDALRSYFGALHNTEALSRSESESVPLDAARGRVTAKPVWAKVSSPHYDSAAMDGIAVHSSTTVGATETSPVRLAVGDEAVWVDTARAYAGGFRRRNHGGSGA